ncbi:MAG TPA: hypothetical protein VIT01_13115 [Acidimicrobiales bacterium]
MREQLDCLLCGGGKSTASPRSVPYLPLVRRSFLVTIPLLLLVGCSGDDDATVAEQLGDDPTSEECMDGFRQILESAEVPEGESEDGIDEDELRRAGDAVRDAFENEGLDPEGFDDLCAQKTTGPEAATEFTEIVNSVDPVLAAVITGITGETGESSTSSTTS